MKFLLPATLSLLLLTGCYTSEVSPTYAAEANKVFSEIEQNSKQHLATNDQTDRMARLWRDKPEYVAIVKNQTKAAKAPRLVSSVAPSYPLMPLLAKIKGQLIVSFIVDERGNVEAARILESSDARFDGPAIQSVLKWKFLPAENETGPIKAALGVPIVFDGLKK